jgi:23S rRNA (uracil1939-C5)-methyltransferase
MRDLLFNLQRAGVPARAEQSAAEAYLAGLDKAPDFVLLDPPRAGLGRAVVQQLARLLPQRLTIVSCDPATLARDLRGLVDAGYAIEHFVMIDLFPQTYHVETIAHLRRR